MEACLLQGEAPLIQIPAAPWGAGEESFNKKQDRSQESLYIPQLSQLLSYFGF